jgi:hypothetical protein
MKVEEGLNWAVMRMFIVRCIVGGKNQVQCVDEFIRVYFNELVQ